MSKISFTMNNVSQIAVSPINANATVSASSGSNSLTFAGVVVSQKGKPFEVISVTADNWMEKLGRPFHSSIGVHADPMRALNEALVGGNGLVVRVVPSDATYPVLKLSKPVDTVVVSNEALAVSADLTLEDGEFLALGIKDGAQSDERFITLEPADAVTYGAGMFTLTLVEALAVGGDETLEQFIVSFDPLATDAMGSSAYIETVLDGQSQYLTCAVNPTVAATEVLKIERTAFTGATNGNIDNITADDYIEAIKALKTTVLDFNYVCGLACYDPAVQAELRALATSRRISGYYDINPRLTHEAALEAMKGLSINDHRASFVHIPYTAKCPFYGNQTVWGGSGIGFAAKAKGVAKTSPVGGWHYTPAGSERAIIGRTNLTPIKGVGEANHEEMYKVRLNKLAVSESGALFIDDSLTACAQENYLRFEQVVSIADAMSRDFYALATNIKHMPDGITFESLAGGMKTICEGYEAVGALVAPRNPEVDGTEAWKIDIKQVDIDYWKVTFSFCPTGSGRRILGEPILIR